MKHDRCNCKKKTRIEHEHTFSVKWSVGKVAATADLLATALHYVVGLAILAILVSCRHPQYIHAAAAAAALALSAAAAAAAAAASSSSLLRFFFFPFFLNYEKTLRGSFLKPTNKK